MGYRVFPVVNRIGWPKAVTSIPILLGHYRQLPNFSIRPREAFTDGLTLNVEKNCSLKS